MDESPLDSGLRYFALHCPTGAATSCQYNAARTPNRVPKMKPINPEAAGFPVQLLLVSVMAGPHLRTECLKNEELLRFSLCQASLASAENHFTCEFNSGE